MCVAAENTGMEHRRRIREHSKVTWKRGIMVSIISKINVVLLTAGDVMLIERWGKCWPSVTPSSPAPQHLAASTSEQSEQQQQPIFVHQMSAAQCLEPCLAPVRGHYFIHASSHSKHLFNMSMHHCYVLKHNEISCGGVLLTGNSKSKGLCLYFHSLCIVLYNSKFLSSALYKQCFRLA